MTLQDEIKEMGVKIKADSYSMSIGELSNLYEAGEIDLHPSFQRFFRWSNAQKTKLVESIFLGIPLPPIFVSQREDGVWDVIDGLQRLSSIFEFMGILRDDDEKLKAPLELGPAKYLPSLEGKRFASNEDDADDDETDDGPFLNRAQRLYFKRAKVDVNIILQQSDVKAKYELFQRLNTGGSQLSDQEVRNCILIMIRPDMFEWMQALSRNGDFKTCVSLSDRLYAEQFELELVLRFLVLRTQQRDELRRINDIGEFLTEWMVKLAESDAIDRVSEEQAFNETFSTLARTLGDDAFRRYDAERNRFLGAFLISAYEAVALGIGYHATTGKVSTEKYKAILADRVKQLWSETEYLENQGSGTNASRRIPKLIPFGREYFSP